MRERKEERIINGRRPDPTRPDPTRPGLIPNAVAAAAVVLLR